MQVSSKKKKFLPNDPSCTILIVSFNGVSCGNGICALHIKVRRESEWKTKLNSMEKSHKDHVVGVHNACSSSRLIAGDRVGLKKCNIPGNVINKTSNIFAEKKHNSVANLFINFLYTR
ncbi:hypothetical protein TNCV_4813881 [Trichonephila clavipes]|nr:hypothetical protein TNCV_4813881 [Trichonephila clavipes]